MLTRLKISHKIALSIFTGSLPIGVMLVLILGGINDRIGFTQKEKNGRTYQRPHVSTSARINVR